MEITINEIEHKFSQKDGKPYTRVNTDKGWFSAFDSNVIEKLKTSKGQTISIEAKITDKYKNIIAILGDGSSDVPTAISKEGEVSYDKPKSVVGKSTTMYTSYAKDIYCNMDKSHTALTEEALMYKAIALVKLAKEAFT